MSRFNGTGYTGSESKDDSAPIEAVLFDAASASDEQLRELARFQAAEWIKARTDRELLEHIALRLETLSEQVKASRA